MQTKKSARPNPQKGFSQYQRGTRKAYRPPVLDAGLFYDPADGRKWRARCLQKREAWIALLDVGHGRVMVRATERQMAALKHQSRRTFRRALSWLKAQGFFANVKKEGYHTGCLVRLLNPARLGQHVLPVHNVHKCQRKSNRESEIIECDRSSTVESGRTSTSECGRVKAFKTLKAVGEKNTQSSISGKTDDRVNISPKSVSEKPQNLGNPFCLEEDELLILAVRERLAKKHAETHKNFKLNTLHDIWFKTAIEFIDDRGDEPIKAPVAYFATSIEALLVDSADDDSDLFWVNTQAKETMRRRQEFEKHFQYTLSFESERTRQQFNAVPSPEQMNRWAMGELSDADLGLDKQHGIYSCPNGPDCPLCNAKMTACDRLEGHTPGDPDCDCAMCTECQEYDEQQELNPLEDVNV